MLAVSIPETVTPWLVLGTSFLTFVGLAGAAWLWLWKRALWPAFQGGVMDAVTPLQQSIDRLASSVTLTEKRVEQTLGERSTELDGKFAALDRRLQALEIQRSRDIQRVLEGQQAVKETVKEALSPSPVNGDTAEHDA